MAGRKDLIIEQGATFDLQITITSSAGVPFVLTGWTPRGQVRKTHRSEEVVADFTFDATEGADGILYIQMDATTTAGIEAGETATDTRSKYLYDIEIENDTTHEVKRLLEGIVYISPEITRDT